MARRELWEQVDANLYQVLGVPFSANDAQILEAWRTAAKRAHPDRGGSVADFQAAEVAYEVLSDPLERRRYDRSLNDAAQAEDLLGHSPRRPEEPGDPSSNSRQPGYQRRTYYFPRSQWHQPNVGVWSREQAPDSGFVTEPPVETTVRKTLSPWIILLLVVGVLVTVLAFYFVAALTVLLLVMALAALAARWMKSHSR